MNIHFPSGRAESHLTWWSGNLVIFPFMLRNWVEATWAGQRVRARVCRAGPVLEKVFDGGKKVGGWRPGKERQTPGSQHPLSCTDPHEIPGAAHYPCPLTWALAHRGRGRWRYDKEGWLSTKARCGLASHLPVASLRATATRQIADVGVTEGKTGEDLFFHLS